MRRITHWISLGTMQFGYSACALLLLQQAAAQGPAAGIKERIEASVSRQRSAVDGMAPSVDRQTSSVRRQLVRSQYTTRANAAFFALPPAERLLVQTALPPECDALPPAEIDSLVNTASKSEGVEPELIRGVMKQESAFRPCAVSSKGAMGLMQLMPEVAADLAVGNPFDPRDNVTAGTKLLRQLLQHYDGDPALTLGAYNAGPRRVDADMAIPAIPETANYVERILSLLPIAQMRSLSFDSDLDRP